MFVKGQEKSINNLTSNLNCTQGLIYIYWYYQIGWYDKHILFLRDDLDCRCASKFAPKFNQALCRREKCINRQHLLLNIILDCKILGLYIKVGKWQYHVSIVLLYCGWRTRLLVCMQIRLRSRFNGNSFLLLSLFLPFVFL